MCGLCYRNLALMRCVNELWFSLLMLLENSSFNRTSANDNGSAYDLSIDDTISHRVCICDSMEINLKKICELLPRLVSFAFVFFYTHTHTHKRNKNNLI